VRFARESRARTAHCPQRGQRPPCAWRRSRVSDFGSAFGGRSSWGTRDSGGAPKFESENRVGVGEVSWLAFEGARRHDRGAVCRARPGTRQRGIGEASSYGRHPLVNQRSVF
jgi:hypothetical protein